MTDTEESAPRIALIGATGGMGTYIAQEFAARQVPIRAVVRRPDAVQESELVRPVLADVSDTDALTDALRGSETVVSSWNPGWDDPALYDDYLRGARSIQSAARQAGVRRLLVIGGASSLLDDAGRPLLERGLPPEPYGSGVRAAAEYLEEIRHEDLLDWVFLSPPMECGPMGPSGRTGRYRIGSDHPVLDDEGRNSLSREDLAVAVVDEVLRPSIHRARYTVGY